MGGAVKIKFTAAELAPKQTRRCERHDDKGYNSLPVHAVNIALVAGLAMGFSSGRSFRDTERCLARTRREWGGIVFRTSPLRGKRRIELSGGALTLPPVRENVFIHQHRVTYADCTVGNHVYYARYLDILEAARGEFFRSCGGTLLKWQDLGFMFPVVEAHLRYKLLARYDDLLAVEVWLTAAERVRLNFAYRITNEAGALVLEGETWHVCMNLEEKLKRLPEPFVAAVQPHLRANVE